jgi:hypothetical protein
MAEEYHANASPLARAYAEPAQDPPSRPLSNHLVHDSFDPMAVGIANEGGEVAGVVVLADAGRASIGASALQCSAVEEGDSVSMRGTKGQMKALLRRNGRFALHDRKRRFTDEARRAIADGARCGEEPHVPKWLEARVVEGCGLVEIRDAEREVIEHVTFRSGVFCQQG